MDYLFIVRMVCKTKDRDIGRHEEQHWKKAPFNQWNNLILLVSSQPTIFSFGIILVVNTEVKAGEEKEI